LAWPNWTPWNNIIKWSCIVTIFIGHSRVVLWYPLYLLPSLFCYIIATVRGLTSILGALWLGHCVIILHIPTTILDQGSTLHIYMLAYRHFEHNAKALGALIVITKLYEQFIYGIWLLMWLNEVYGMMWPTCTRVSTFENLIGI